MTDYFTPKIRIGSTVKNSEIVDEFKCNPQGGMRRLYKTNTLVLVSKHIGTRRKYYDDKLIDGSTTIRGKAWKAIKAWSFSRIKPCPNLKLMV